ncbi:MAG TPA: response regulator [Thermoanaerobaculia bacterium]|nr:response regulator [Thermoanaerobaculia bacterium]
MVLLSIRLFGDLSAVDYRGNALSIGNPRIQSLIVYLAMKLSAKSSLAEIGELLFGDPGADVEVRALVRDLRYALRFLPDDIVIDDGTTVRFNRETVEVDAQQFSDLVGAPSISSTRKAAELYRGNLLPQFNSGTRAFDEWIAERRLTFWRGALAIFGNLLSTQIRAGWWEEALETAGRLLELDPSQEVVHRTIIRLQLEQGRPDAALRRYHECVELLRREYGSEPSAETERLHREIQRRLERGSDAPKHGARILVVEDDLVSATLLEGYLAEAGYDVVTVADGAEALAELGRTRFDLLILDINLPTLSGLEVFELMLQKQMETPAMFVTGVAGVEVETQSLEMGAAGFLRKPIRKEALLPRVNGILQRSHREVTGRGHRDVAAE